MRTKVLCVVAATGIWILAVLGLVYCAGRWGNPSFVGAEAGGFLLAFIGVTALVICLKFTDTLRLMVIYLISAVTLLICHELAFSTLLRVYAAGFEKAALSAGASTKWTSLLPLAQTWLSGHSNGTFDRMLPPFVRKVYPSWDPNSAVSGDLTPDLRELSVCVWWRGATLCVGLDIGKGEDVPGELYRRVISNGLSVVIFRGGG